MFQGSVCCEAATDQKNLWDHFKKSVSCPLLVQYMWNLPLQVADAGFELNEHKNCSNSLDFRPDPPTVPPSGQCDICLVTACLPATVVRNLLLHILIQGQVIIKIAFYVLNDTNTD